MGKIDWNYVENEDGTYARDANGNPVRVSGGVSGGNTRPGSTPETEYGHGGNYGVHGFSGSEYMPISGNQQFGNRTAPAAFQLGITDSSGAIRDVLGSRYATFDPVANQQEQARLEQMRVIQAIQAQAAGDPNSQAQQQLAQGYQNAQSQQSSLGSTLRGQSAGAAQRGIQAGQAALGSQMPGQQQMLMLQEQQAAQAMLAQMLAQQRSQDAAWQQGLSGIANDRQGLANANQQFTVGTQYGLDRGMRDANLDLARTRLGLDLEQRNTDRQGLNQWLNAIGSAAGQMYSMGGSNQQATGGSGYRQVDGQNSIVPMNDK